MQWGRPFLWAWSMLFSGAIWIRKRRHPEVDEMDEQTEIFQDLRDAAAWLFSFWP